RQVTPNAMGDPSVRVAHRCSRGRGAGYRRVAKRGCVAVGPGPFAASSAIRAARYGAPRELDRSEDAGVVAERGWDDVVVDRLAELGCVEVAGGQLLHAAANEGQQRGLVHDAAANDDPLR